MVLGGSKFGMAREGDLCWAWPGMGLYVGHGPGGGSMLCIAREGALCCTSPGRGLYVVHRPGWGSMLGMTREGVLWPRMGLYIGHGPEATGEGSI